MSNIISTLPIYVISLSENIARRSELEEQFQLARRNFQYIDAVNGSKLTAKEYFKHILPFYHSQGRFMTPSEVGCALSHMQAMQKLVDSGSPYALILEDDVIGTDDAITRIINIASNLPKNSLLITGGQEGIKSPYLIGKPTKDNVFEIAPLSYDYIYRACCYLVTKETAKIILEHHQNLLTIADWWGLILKNKGIKIYYKELIKHPLDLKNSSLEADRVSLSKTKRKEGFLSKEIFRLVRKLKTYFLIVVGNQRL